MVETLTGYFPQATLVLTMGAEGALGLEPGGEMVRQAAFPAEEVDRLGGGDAFAAGFLYGYLNTSDAHHRLTTALRWGAATAALKYTIPGDAPLVERHEVEALLRGSGGHSVQR
jgi:2-dehydro-3-deoxygluconokinase